MVDDSLIKGDIVFNAKPDAVPYNYRIFDEPAQQSIVPKDMDNFIKSTTFLHTNCQVIMAITLNSHELIEIIDNLKPDTYQKINITGKAFQLLP